MNHLFPNENEPAYTNDLREIGACMFTTRDKGCDSAAFEIKKSVFQIPATWPSGEMTDRKSMQKLIPTV